MSNALLDIAREMQQEETQSPLDLAKSLQAQNNDTPPTAAGSYKAEPFGEVMASGDDWRIEKTEDGPVFVSPGMVSRDEGYVSAILGGATPEEASRQRGAEEFIEEHPIAARGAQAISGVPFVGEYVDEAIDLLYGPKARDAVRYSQIAMEKARPKEAAALQIGGTIAGAVPAAIVAPPIAAKSMLGKTLLGFGLGASGGAVEGYISGYGAGNEEDRLGEAAERGTYGALFGGILGGLAPSVGSAVRGVVRKTMKSPIEEAAKELGTSPEVVNALRAVVDVDDPAKARGIVDKMGAGAMLADFGDDITGVLDTSIQSSAAAGRIAKEAIEPRIFRAGGELSQTLDDILGTPTGKYSAARAIGAESRDAIKQAYAKPFAEAIDFETPAGRKILKTISTIPRKVLNEALEGANEEMALAALRGEIAESPKLTLESLQNPTVMQLDFIKRSLDSIREAGTDRLAGTVSPEARRAGGFARVLRDAVSDAVPSYREALDTAADSLSRKSAVDTGYNLLRRQTKVDAAGIMLEGMTDAQRESVKSGVRSYISDVLNDVGAVASDPDVGMREVSRIFRELTSSSSRKKLTSLLGPEEAGKIFAKVDNAGIALRLRAKVAANSATYGRAATRQQAEAFAGFSALERGDVGGATKEIIQAATASTDEAVAHRMSGFYADIADALVNIRGADAERALKLLKNVNVLEPISQAKAQFIAKVVTGGLIPAQQEFTRMGAE